MHLVVLLHRFMGKGERAALPEGAQSHVHAIAEAVFGDGIEAVDEFLRQFAEEGFVIGGFVSLRFSAVCIDEDEVDVRGEVQFASAEFAHAEDGHAHFVALAVKRIAVTGGKFFIMPVEGGIGECGGKVGERFDKALLFQLAFLHGAYQGAGMAVAAKAQITEQRRFVRRLRDVAAVRGKIVGMPVAPCVDEFPPVGVGSQLPRQICTHVLLRQKRHHNGLRARR